MRCLERAPQASAGIGRAHAELSVSAPGAPPRREGARDHAIFWIVKVLTTGMGEISSDFLVHHLNPVLAVTLGALGFALSLLLQFRARTYVSTIYWGAVVMVSIFGTMAADVLHVVLGVPYLYSTAFYAVVLALLFLFWQRTGRTLSIHSITGGRREFFYWATILATFALGTAGGDMTATSLGWGYLASGILFAALIALPAIARRWFGWSEIFAFWFAYVVTRPLGLRSPTGWGNRRAGAVSAGVRERSVSGGGSRSSASSGISPSREAIKNDLPISAPSRWSSIAGRGADRKRSACDRPDRGKGVTESWARAPRSRAKLARSCLVLKHWVA